MPAMAPSSGSPRSVAFYALYPSSWELYTWWLVSQIIRWYTLSASRQDSNFGRISFVQSEGEWLYLFRHAQRAAGEKYKAAPLHLHSAVFSQTQVGSPYIL